MSAVVYFWLSRYNLQCNWNVVHYSQPVFEIVARGLSSQLEWRPTNPSLKAVLNFEYQAVLLSVTSHFKQLLSSENQLQGTTLSSV